ncbi:hypothetical protein PV08_03062 [Exophiala spinifera]|uniref:ADA HAT complex component 1 n=1 Tax=Exophiala spinifera TaxID=91928 RepID=A0A0D2BIK4_9EURO|nr:uncharacterized protein PV08_03062 [Exophiala spinifera]KIW18773.1 hypothetical protein PV08_03062 [Exophiala spinifera]
MVSVPGPSAITSTAVQTALELYPSLVDNVYNSKMKDPKKVKAALERETWRFEELPQELGHQKARKGGLSKEQVERLVQWKITHGQSRPFLPAMVRKNDASFVTEQTTLGCDVLDSESRPPSTGTVTAALDAVCKLSGIGPATGTLILNIFDPINIPFFQDEMYAWVFPDSKATKLKYTQKEYIQLLEAVRPVLKRLGVKAVELEKASYVFGHMDFLDEHGRTKLEDAFRNEATKKDNHETLQEDKIIAQRAASERTTRGSKRGAIEDPETGSNEQKRKKMTSKSKKR